MESESRVKKSLLNAKIGLLFYFLSMFVTFFSRKVFLDYLGDEFIGLTGTLTSILSVLNLAEFGIGFSIAYFLYDPIQKGNKERINEVVSVCGYLYHKIGYIILTGAFLVSLFFPLIFADTIFSYTLIYFSFASILGSALIGYFINYRNLLLQADQKGYLVNAYYQTGLIVKILIQIGLAYLFSNLYVWVSIEFTYSIFTCLILNWKIRQEYPWLKANVKQGKESLAKYPEIWHKSKQIIVHRLAGFVLKQSDQLFVFAFVSLKMVAYYGNYVLITAKLVDLINATFAGITAGIGNMVAEGNHSKIKQVFWEFMAFRYFIAALICTGLLYYISPVIVLWVGSDYVLDSVIVYLLCVHVFITLTRETVDNFNAAYGNYSDVWAAGTEAAINIVVTVVAASQYGLIGILLGKIVSTFIIIVLWKPYFLYHKGFKTSVMSYWINVFRYVLLIGLYLATMHYWVAYMDIPQQSFIDTVLHILQCYVPVTVFFTVVFVLLAPGARMLVKRFIKLKWL